MSPARDLPDPHTALLRDFLADQSTYLARKIKRPTPDLLGTSAPIQHEPHDREIAQHGLRTQQYVHVLAQHLQQLPRLQTVLDDATVRALVQSAPLHDIGKVGIPEHILMKPGRLTSNEFDVVKQHTTLGWGALCQAALELGRYIPFLHHAKDVAFSHHERWDGSGYPQGLAEDTIPLTARIMAVADVYDALVSRRAYKSTVPHEEAVEIIHGGRGSHFDPYLVDAFLGVQNTFRSIASRFAHSADATPAAPR